MQWFEKNGIKPEAFQSRFSIDHLYNLYKSEKISKETKDKIYNPYNSDKSGYIVL